MRKAAKTNNELFDRFWKAYPRKEGKPKALRTFEKLDITEDVLKRLLDELRRQYKEKDWKHTNTKYIPMPQTWLNRRDWEEDRSGTDQCADTADTRDQYGSAIY